MQTTFSTHNSIVVIKTQNVTRASYWREVSNDQICLLNFISSLHASLHYDAWCTYRAINKYCKILCLFLLPLSFLRGNLSLLFIHSVSFSHIHICSQKSSNLQTLSGKKNSLCCDFKQDTDSHFLGSSFQSTGAFTVKPLSPVDFILDPVIDKRPLSKDLMLHFGT